MPSERWKVVLGIATLAFVLSAGGSSSGEPAADAVPGSAVEILRCAFDKRYGRRLAQVIDVAAKRDDVVVRRFRIQMASMPVDGHFRSLVYFLRPSDHRGMRVLTLERDDRRDEHFVFVPFLDRVKRVYGGRRQESFLGTEFTYEDMERLRVEELEVGLRPPENMGGEVVHVVSAVPRTDSGYMRSEYRVAASDCNILEIRHFKHGHDAPAKVMTMPRDRMQRLGDELMPTFAVARDLQSGRSTELSFSEIRLDPDLDPKDFTVPALDRMTGIPGLPRREEPGGRNLDPAAP